jgi:hypothetical protein
MVNYEEGKEESMRGEEFRIGQERGNPDQITSYYLTEPFWA